MEKAFLAPGSIGKAIFNLFEKCLACKGCEIACAVEHSQSKSLFGALAESPRPRPRVRVENAGAFSYPARCMHCQDAACLAACPTGAMHRDAASRAVLVSADRCIGCWMCVMVCPFGGVSADPVAHKAFKCDRCPDRSARGLEPACVVACPSRALFFGTPEEMASRQRQVTAHSAVAGAQPRTAEPLHTWRNLQGRSLT